MSLRAGDLHDLIDRIVEIDSYKSKMGSDKDIVTVAISVRSHDAAKDLVSFIERGYSFVLDAEDTSGEQRDGMYRVFVELDRTRNSVDDILELFDGISKVSSENDFKFRYYKSFRSVPLTKEELDAILPVTPEEYERRLREYHLNNYTNFFDKSMVESVYMTGNMLVIEKKWADPVAFKFVDFGETSEVMESVAGSFDINAYPEIMFLTKYIGDYNISKYSNKLTLENANKTLVLERHVV